VVDEVIAPHRTRQAIADAITGAFPVRGAHGNIPL
jgi:acetyl-CoA/propionyl-CoA carboxylase carboxyl transferase subunit